MAKSASISSSRKFLRFLVFCVSLATTCRWRVLSQRLYSDDEKLLQSLFKTWSVENLLETGTCNVREIVKCSPDGAVQHLNLEGTGLRGQIPDAIGNLSQLTTLNLGHNELIGSIPPGISQLKDLVSLRLGHNQLTGRLDAFINVMMDARNISEMGQQLPLVYLDVSNNQLTGVLPPSLSNSGIPSLLVNGNKLTGDIPLMFPMSDVNFSNNYFTSYPQEMLGLLSTFGVVVDWNCIADPSFPNQRPRNDCLTVAPSVPPLAPPSVPPLPQPQPAPAQKKGTWQLPVIAVGVVMVIVCAGLSTFYCCFWRRKRQQRQQRGESENKMSQFAEANSKGEGSGSFAVYSLWRLRSMTRGWSDANLLGQGGYGSVYKGTDRGGEVVAVKRLNRASKREGASANAPSSAVALVGRQFRTELAVLSQLRHRNLVRLHGYCCQAGERIIVMDYATNGSLAQILFNKSSSSDHRLKSTRCLLDWPTRFKIAVGTAEALRYLHSLSLSGTAVLHCDVKSDNILLDNTLSPLVCDFGLARLTPMRPDKSHSHTANVQGTDGYMAPEWLLFGKLSDKLDVYSFGVVLLELVTGKSGHVTIHGPNGQEDRLGLVEAGVLAATTRPDMLTRIIDPDIKGQVSVEDMLPVLHVALRCVLYDPRERPNMEMVLAMLRKAVSIPPLPTTSSSWLRWSNTNTTDNSKKKGLNNGNLSGSASGDDDDDDDDDDCTATDPAVGAAAAVT